MTGATVMSKAPSVSRRYVSAARRMGISSSPSSPSSSSPAAFNWETALSGSVRDSCFSRSRMVSSQA